MRRKAKNYVRRYIALLLVVTMLPFQNMTVYAKQTDTVLYDVESRTSDNSTSENTLDIAQEQFVLNQNWKLEKDEIIYEMYMESGTLDLNGHTLTILGDMIQSGGTIKINSGALYVYGDFHIQGDIDSNVNSVSKGELRMMQEADYVSVSGNFLCNTYGDSTMMKAGTIEVWGDFTAKRGFWPTENHKVVLKGENTQTINMSSGTKYATLEIQNISKEGVNVQKLFLKDTLITNGCKMTFSNHTGEFGWTLSENTVWEGDLSLVEGELDLNGHDLTVEGNFWHKGGTLKISGGTFTVEQDYRMETKAEKYSTAKLSMKQDDDRVTVGGDFVVRTNASHTGYLIDGELEVKGDFLVYTVAEMANFYPTDNHTVILSGGNAQIVQIANRAFTGNGFQNLIVENKSEEGITLSDEIPVRGKVTTRTECPIAGKIGIGPGTTFYHTEKQSAFYKGNVYLLDDYTVIETMEIEGDVECALCDLHVKNDMKVTGNVSGSSKIQMINACMDVTGDFTLVKYLYYNNYGGLIMQHEKDRLIVGGDFTHRAYGYYDRITDGVVEVKGDVYLHSGYTATENHKLLLSGDSLQTIDVDTTCSIATLELMNESVAGVVSKKTLMVDELITNGCRLRYEGLEGETGFCLQNDMTVNGDFTLTDGVMDLNGHTLTINGDLTQIGGVLDVNQGTLQVNGNYYLKYRTQNGKTDGIGTGMLYMNREQDLVKIKGDFIVHSAVATNGHLTAGRMEVGGDVKSDSNIFFSATGSHRLVLNGNKEQILKLDGDAQVCHLIFENTSAEDVLIESVVKVTGNLTDHSNNIGGSGCIKISQTANITDGYFGGNLQVVAEDKLVSDLEIGGKLKTDAAFWLNGYTLYAKNLYVNGRFIIDGGTLNVLNNMNITYEGILEMSNDADNVLVSGDFLMTSGINHERYLTSGRLKVCGDFQQKAYKNFVSTGNHTTILGAKKDTDGNIYVQNIVFEHPGEAHFHTLILEKMRHTGYVFSADVYSLADEVIENVTDETAPTPISEICAEKITASSVTVSYNGAWDENGIAAYYIYRNGKMVGISNETIYEDKGLMPEQTYVYVVYALDESGNRSVASKEIEITTQPDVEDPEIVTGLAVDRVTGSAIYLQWDNGKDNGLIAGYHIYRDGEKIAEDVKNNCFKDTSITPMTVYSYCVTAVDGVGNESKPCEEIVGAGFMPKVLAVTPEDTAVIGGPSVKLSIRFKDVGNSTGNIVEIAWQEQGSDTWNAITNFPLSQQTIQRGVLGTSTQWDLSEIEGEKNVDVRFTVTDEDGNKTEQFVSYYVDKTGALAPDEVSLRDQGGNLLLSWNRSASSDCAGYNIYRLNEKKQWENIAKLSGQNNTSYLDCNVIKGKDYNYCIRAYDRFGQEGNTSEIVTGTPGEDTVVPVILSVSPENPLTSGSVIYTIEAEDNCMLERLCLYLSRADETEKTLMESRFVEEKKAKETFEIDTTVYEDGRYLLYAEAVDANGNISSEYKRYYNIDNTGIGKMTWNNCTTASTAIRLNWQDVTEEDFSYFSVEQKMENKFEQIAQVKNVLSYTKQNLTPGTAYTFRVAAYDKAGNRGTASDEITLITEEDTISPQIVTVGPVEGAFNNSIPLKMNVKDNHTVGTATFSWSLDKTNFEQITQFASKNNKSSEVFSYEWDVSSLPEGDIYVRFEAEDLAGNKNAPAQEGDIVATYQIDRTPPSQIKGVKADGEEGKINLTWEKKEDDTVFYRIYRAREDGIFRILTEINRQDYTDTEIIIDKSYHYYVTAVDEAGNESEPSLSAEAMAQPDRQAPVISGISHDNKEIISRHTEIKVLAVDNAKMKCVRLEYREKDSNNNYRRMEVSQTDQRSCYAVFTMQEEELMEGITYEYRFVAIDQAGNVSEYVEREFTFDLTPPAGPELIVESESFRVALSWSKNSEPDFAYYNIYRKKYGEEEETCILTTQLTSYEDKNVEPDSIYFYRVEACDLLGNSASSKEKYSYANTIDTVAPTIQMPQRYTVTQGNEITMDASLSNDNVRIVSYVWEFGDDSWGSGAIVKHRYRKSGDYTVTLTVYDAMGNSDSETIIVSVFNQKTNFDTTVLVKNTEGTLLSGANVFIKNMQTGTTEEYLTDSMGKVTFSGADGYYSIAAFSAGYLPEEKNILLVMSEEKEVVFWLTEGSVTAGEIQCRRMELDELIEEGVDLSDPDNYHCYEYELVLTFAKEQLPSKLKLVGVPKGASHDSGSQGNGLVHNGQGEIIPIFPEGRETEKPIIAHMLVSGGISWLKEMYAVDLSIINCVGGGSFTLENATAMLDVPEGLSFVRSNKALSTQVDMGTIHAGETKRASWVVRGDKPGDYSVGAQFSANLMPFQSRVYSAFASDVAISVEAGEGLHVYIKPENAYYIGRQYYIYCSLVNESGRNFYNVNMRLGTNSASPDSVYEGTSGAEQNDLIETYDVPAIGALGEESRLKFQTYIDDITADVYVSTEKQVKNIDETLDNVLPTKRYVYRLRKEQQKTDEHTGLGSSMSSENRTDCKVSKQDGVQGDSVTATVLYPGDSINILYSTSLPEGGDPTTEYYKLVDALANTLRGGNLGVEVSIQTVDSHVPEYYRYNHSPDIMTEYYGDPVSMVNGAFLQEINTLSVSGGQTISVDLTYNSLLCDKNREGGYGFTHSYEQYIIDRGAAWITLREGAGMEQRFVKKDNEEETNQESVIYEPAEAHMEGCHIEKNVDGYILYMKDKTKMTFDIYGYLTGILNKDGRNISVFWEQNDMIVEDDLSGEQLRLIYTEKGHLAEVRDNHGRCVKLTYDVKENLESVTDPIGNVTQFKYNDYHHMTAVINAEGEETVTNGYDLYGRVIMQKETERKAPTVFSYVETPDGGMVVKVVDHLGNESLTESDAKGNVLREQNAKGQSRSYTYDENDNLIRFCDGDGSVTSYTYDDNEFLTSMTDPEGNTISYTYDADGNVTQVQSADGAKSTYTYGKKGEQLTYTNPLGSVQTRTYDATGYLLTQQEEGKGTVTYRYDRGRVTEIIDARGGVTRLVYDEFGNVTSQTDAEGNKSQWIYDAAGNLLSEIHPNGEKICYTYDKLGQVIKQTETAISGEERTKSFTYDKAGRMTSETDSIGRITRYTYDEEDHLIKVDFPDGTNERYTYDKAGNMSTHIAANGLKTTYVTDVRGNVTELKVGEKVYQYDVLANGKIQKETRPDGSTISYSYDSNYNCISRTDELGNTYRNTYDAMGNLTETTDPLGNKVSYTYDRTGREIAQTDEGGNTTAYVYDENGNITCMTDAMGYQTCMTYDLCNRMTKVVKTVSGNAVINTFSYDAAGNLRTLTDAMGEKTTFVYNAFGEPVTETDKLGVEVRAKAYDAAGRVITEADALGNKMTYSYDVNDRVTELTSGAGTKQAVSTSYDYDTAGNLTGTTDAEAGEAKAVYDLYGNMVMQTDAMGNRVVYEYDLMDRCIKETNALGKSQEYVYDKKGNLKEYTDFSGLTTVYDYDKAGRLVKEKKGLFEKKYTYDSAGNLLTVTDESGTICRIYDKLNRVTEVTDCNGKTIKYGYDELGNRISITYPGGKTVRYTWDECQNLTGVTDITGAVTTYRYDAAGRLIETIRPDQSTESRTYDAAGRLKNIEDVAKDGELTQSLTYRYDSRGNIVEIENHADAEIPKNRNGAENMTCTYGKDNRLTTWNGQNVTYDDNGNMTRGPVGGQMADLTYNVWNRLIKVTTADGAETVYSYDAESVRIGATHTEADGSTWEEAYVTDRETTYSQLLTAERDGKETVYTYGIGLTSATEGKGTFYYHYDHLGSTTALTDKSGAVTARAAYGTYGELLGVTGAAGNSLTSQIGEGALRFFYNAQYGIQTDVNALYYMRARYYSLDARRFTALDALRGDLSNTQSLNRYSYVQSNPVSSIDPLGLCPEYYGGRLPTIDKHTLLGVLSCIPGVGCVFGFYDAYLYAKEGNGFMATCSALGAAAGLFGFGAMGTKLLAKSGVIKTATASIIQKACTVGAVGSDVAVGGMLFGREIKKAFEEKIRTGQISDETKQDLLVMGAIFGATAAIGINTLKRATPGRIADKAIGKGKSASAAAETSGLATVLDDGAEVVGKSGTPSGFYQDVNGRCHRPNGQFASNAEVGITSPAKVSTGSHGNSLSDPRTNYGYVLVDRNTNEILKFGETIHPTTRYSKSYLDANNANMMILEQGNKLDIHLWQHDMNEYYFYKYNEYPPLNSGGW